MTPADAAPALPAAALVFPLLVGVAAIHLAGLGEWRDGWRTTASWAIETWRPCPRRRRIRHIAWTAAGAVTLVPLFALSLYPPTAFDETLYHLPFARAFASMPADRSTPRAERAKPRTRSSRSPVPQPASSTSPPRPWHSTRSTSRSSSIWW